MDQPRVATTPEPQAAQTPGTVRPLGAMSVEEVQDRLFNVIVLVVISIVFLAAGGSWAYRQVGSSLREIRTAGLNSLLEAQSRILVVWIEEKKRDAQRWASTPQVQAAAARLARLAASGAGPAQYCAPASQRALLATIAPFAQFEDVAVFNLMTRDGTIIASQLDGYCGRHVVDAEFLALVAPVFSGKTVFVRPWQEASRLDPGRGTAFKQPLVWVEAPVFGDGGEVIATLGFGRLADPGFGRLLLQGVAETSREAYSFDTRGIMLSESRYQEKLQEAGILPAGQPGLGRLALRDPGGDLLAGFRPGPSANERPLTLLAQTAIDGLRSGSAGSGALLEPYRSYRGAEVIGAWRWLPQKELAIAVEIDAAEAYAPLQQLRIAFEVMFGFVFVSLLGAGGMSYWAVRLRLREAKRIGQYAIEREIGEGGMSHVYLARHPRLKRPTAVKVLKPHLANDEVIKRFEREVQLCSQLTHPNTIEIYDYGRTRDGAFYYAMEFLHGISLQDLVEAEGPMPVWRVVHALRQACGSLREAHERGLVHRDVKPANLMLCLRGGQCDVLKILDFGLVKEMHNPDTRDITQYARVLGTPLYMAPERLRNPADADARADIYALGAVAHFLLTGRKLFDSESDHDLVYQVLNAEVPTVSAHGARDAPEALEALLVRCVAKDRQARPATIEEVDAVLAEVERLCPWRASEARAWWKAREARVDD
jgi:serine/threonine-protein kinase